jgi:23S rRNA (adenine2503-C2)-methyltransferase
MGQGEPLYNFKNVEKAIKILTDPYGISLSPNKITISTSGIAPLIPKIAINLGVQLAISLHASNNDLRSNLMSINKTYPLEVLLESCKEFQRISKSSNKRITFEYVMLDQINDDIEEDGKQIIKLVKDLHCHINLM